MPKFIELGAEETIKTSELFGQTPIKTAHENQTKNLDKNTTKKEDNKNGSD